MKIIYWTFGLFLICLGGCAPSQPYMTSQRLQRGWVVVLPGIEGRSLLNEQIRDGLAEGGVNWAIEIYDWTSRWGMLASQRDEAANRKKAATLAKKIEAYQVTHPARPVVLVGQSGGGAMAVWTAEALGPDHPVRAVVLLNGSLSPDYPLQKALAGTINGIANFYSGRDWMLLGLGTSMAGTMDGRHTVSAGLKGFTVPASTPAAYDKLHQIAWSEEMSVSGHFGGHLSSAASAFVAEYVAPLVLWPEWTPDKLSRLGKPSVWQTIGSPADWPETPPSTPPASQAVTQPTIRSEKTFPVSTSNQSNP